MLAKAAAIVTDRGGRTCHAAIVARELGIPCVVGGDGATRRITTGQHITVSCAEGSDGRVYPGLVQFERDVIDPAALPVPRVPVMLDVGNPDTAFALGQLPSAGVGLGRIELIISSQIGAHPMALLHPRAGRGPRRAAALLDAARRFPSPAEMFIDGLASGVARIAAAFYQPPVIVRFSDIETNETRGCLAARSSSPSRRTR